MRVLVVEDDPSVGKMLRQALTEAGHTLTVVSDGYAAVKEATDDQDLVILDIMLPGISGLEVCKRVRANGVKTPILIVTAKDLVDDRVAGLDAGADDYLVKPFHLSELLARVRALLRRTHYVGGPITVANVVLDPQMREIKRGGKSIPLSSTEFFLIEYLMKNPGTVRTRSEILEHVWKYDFDGNDNVLDVYISYLRKKLDQLGAPNFIKTVRGVGFTVDEGASE